MIGLLTKWFGFAGRVLFVAMTESGDEFRGTASIESLNVGNEEAESLLKAAVSEKYDVSLKWLRIVSGSPDLQDNL